MSGMEIRMGSVETRMGSVEKQMFNFNRQVFDPYSPIELNQLGERWLVESGLKEYIDAHKEVLLEEGAIKPDANPYEIQRYIFDLFDTLKLKGPTMDKLERFAFQNGATVDILRRIGAIYFRNVYMKSKMKL